MSHTPIPPEFTIQPTQVILRERPDIKTFWPNNLGSQGSAVMSVKKLHAAKMDPITVPAGHSAAAAAAEATMDMAKGILRIHENSQTDHTVVDEHEGGTVVTMHQDSFGEELGRDDQISNVGGYEVTGDPGTLSAILRQAGSDPVRPAARTVEKARDVGYQQTDGMTPTTQAAFAQMLAHKGGEAYESLAEKPVSANVQAATASGMVMRPELMGVDSASLLMRQQMRIQSAKQNSAPAKPMAQYHPAQSNFERQDGSINSATMPVPAYIPRIAAPVGPTGPRLQVGAGNMGFLPRLTAPTVRQTRILTTADTSRVMTPLFTSSSSIPFETKRTDALAAEAAAKKAAAEAAFKAAAAARVAADAQVKQQMTQVTLVQKEAEVQSTRITASAAAVGVPTAKATADVEKKEAAAQLAAARQVQAAQEAAAAKAKADAEAFAAQQAKAAAAKAAADAAAAKAEADARTPLQLSESRRRTPGPAPTQSGAPVRQSGWVHNDKGERCAVYSDGKTRCELIPVATGGYDMNPGGGSADQRPPVPGIGTEDTQAYVGEDGLPRYVEEAGNGSILGMQPKTLVLGGLAVLAGLSALAVITK